MKWDEMTQEQQYEFCEKHGFDRYPDPVVLAKDALSWLEQHGPYDDEDGIEFYEQPLIELGENKLWKDLQNAYNKALYKAGWTDDL